jgi:hypothetical protein
MVRAVCVLVTGMTPFLNSDEEASAVRRNEQPGAAIGGVIVKSGVAQCTR